MRRTWPLAAMFALLILTWLATDPPGAVPDEEAHFYKAVAAGGLHVMGIREDEPPREGQRVELAAESTRDFVIPGRLSSNRLGCNRMAPSVPASCQRGASSGAGEARVSTYVAVYPPFLYVAPGWLARLAGDPLTAVYLGRLAMATLGLGLLVIAAISLWDPSSGGLSLVGLLVAVTPMVHFLVASLNVSGVEIAAGTCFLAVLVTGARRPRSLRCRAVPLGVAGTVLALSRPTGPVWVLIGVAVYALLVGRRLPDEVRQGGMGVAGAGAAIVSAGLLTAGWTLWRGPSSPFPASESLRVGPSLLRELPSLASQAVGVFGWLDTAMPAWAYWLWGLVALPIILAGAAVGTTGERLALALVGIAVVAAALVAQGMLLGPVEVTEQWFQTRYVLPLAVGLPLIAGEALTRRLAGLPRLRAGLPLVVIVTTTVVHLQALHANARRNAVGLEGPAFFLSQAVWAPPGGWVLWSAAAWLVVVLALLTWLLTSLPTRSRPLIHARRARGAVSGQEERVNGRRHRIVVATCDPITARMAGPAIRAWNIAEVLAAEHDVQLVTIESCERSHPRFPVRRVASEDLRELERWMDVLVFQGGLLRIHPFLLESDKVIVADLYDPFHLENLEQTPGQSPQEREARIRHLTGVLNEQLERGDFFLCASPRQRDFWLGSLAALGRVNPATYDEDETLSSLVAVVPFGLPCDPPSRAGPALRGVVPGIGPDDHVILWAGGVYNWFDPLTLVRGVDRIRRRLPTVRLYFLGMQHPNPNIPEMPTAARLRTLAAELGLTGRHVFFNEGWVDYDARAAFLLDADVGVSTHLDHVETAYSFRTRILDYLWAGLPVVATRGDALGELIEREGLGLTVPAGDVEALAAALERLLGDDELARSCRHNSARVAPRFRWRQVLAPLVAFARSPRRAPDLVRPSASAAASATAAPSAPRRRRRPLRGPRS